MITRVTGQIVSKIPLEVQTAGGLTYEVIVSDRTLGALTEGDQAEILVYHYIREGFEELYGFGSHSDKRMFNELIKISGVGPKIAMAILGVYTVSELQELLADNDFVALAKVPGLGKKGAQKIIVELSSKIDEGGFDKIMDGTSADESSMKIIAELKMALKNLGYGSDEIEPKVKKAYDIIKEKPGATIEQILGEVIK